MSELGPGCVKTSIRGECAELFSLFSSFDDACQSDYLPIQRNRDKSFYAKVRARSFHTAWVKNGSRGLAAGFLLCPGERTSSYSSVGFTPESRPCIRRAIDDRLLHRPTRDRRRCGFRRLPQADYA